MVEGEGAGQWDTSVRMVATVWRIVQNLSQRNPCNERGAERHGGGGGREGCGPLVVDGVEARGHHLHPDLVRRGLRDVLRKERRRETPDTVGGHRGATKGGPTSGGVWFVAGGGDGGWHTTDASLRSEMSPGTSITRAWGGHDGSLWVNDWMMVGNGAGFLEETKETEPGA